MVAPVLARRDSPVLDTLGETALYALEMMLLSPRATALKNRDDKADYGYLGGCKISDDSQSEDEKSKYEYVPASEREREEIGESANVNMDDDAAMQKLAQEMGSTYSSGNNLSQKIARKDAIRYDEGIMRKNAVRVDSEEAADFEREWARQEKESRETELLQKSWKAAAVSSNVGVRNPCVRTFDHSAYGAFYFRRRWWKSLDEWKCVYSNDRDREGKQQQKNNPASNEQKNVKKTSASRVTGRKTRDETKIVYKPNTEESTIKVPAETSLVTSRRARGKSKIRYEPNVVENAIKVPAGSSLVSRRKTRYEGSTKPRRTHLEEMQYYRKKSQADILTRPRRRRQSTIPPEDRNDSYDPAWHEDINKPRKSKWNLFGNNSNSDYVEYKM
eukprot:CAMPEP_0204873912 /NCGR_PEP_ID=MMETSP1348-20121228/41883_1 /ASSEMBLY_ACC=CAM_ASM_000700 /TAXON_ID=215587 /ORGANISM="Aplanochytrium stocchinoi, Strain GSBS06" /LENGTH=387 /DNA_ID=CAMNT_0052029469 /DNA_START=228 /DNA_END=1391 /DNA_ORIENTATION=+